MRLIRKIIRVLGNTLVTTGEVGLTVFGLAYLWSASKIAFIFALTLVGIITVIDKIKDNNKEVH